MPTLIMIHPWASNVKLCKEVGKFNITLNILLKSYIFPAVLLTYDFVMSGSGTDK